MRYFLGLMFMGIFMSHSFAGDHLPEGSSTAIFAGGCFWCLQPSFDHTKGVVSTRVGYTGGQVPNPTYEAVSSGLTGHVEAIEVVYDPVLVSYELLINVFWRSMDPTDDGGQFADRGSQYRTAIFYRDDDQKKQAEEAIRTLAASEKFKRPIVTRALPADEFYPAEEYHQKYYLKQSGHYNDYKEGSGRAAFIKKMW